MLDDFPVQTAVMATSTGGLKTSLTHKMKYKYLRHSERGTGLWILISHNRFSIVYR